VLKLSPVSLENIFICKGIARPNGPRRGKRERKVISNVGYGGQETEAKKLVFAKIRSKGGMRFTAVDQSGHSSGPINQNFSVEQMEHDS